MLEAGHVTVNGRGELTGVDAAFCDILKSQPHKVRGKLVLDVTAPADRTECAAAIAKLIATGTPFSIVKRFLCDDGSLVWVRNTVSLMAGGNDPGAIVATIEPVITHDGGRDPALLLETARFLVAGRRDRATICDPSLFSEPGWDAILAAYVAEAEGRAVDATGLAEALGYPHAVVTRWVRALEQHGVLELETRNPTLDREKAFRLTADTHRKLETYLAQIVVNAPRMTGAHDPAE
ncbi:PAS domain-containing protein [Sphingomonas sp. R86520]|uniref:PAS domain-containing protein n=1 Tax=Sphingomonas sp. R86520 TaxID=3093859 RepID=UPI0036D3D8D4